MAGQAPNVITAAVNKLLRRAASAAQENRRDDAAQRNAAANILDADTIATEDYDAARLLFTTLGGQLRPITAKDLVKFKRSATQLGKRYKGGITAKGVIEHSRPDDRRRARDQIRLALPYSTKGNVIQFVTNAGPDSDVTRHFVTVELVNYDAAVASPLPLRAATDKIVRSFLRFDCDCGRHRYWYRYIATVGGFNSGRGEPGFPKIRNPTLYGVACKHVLRVMGAIQQPPLQQYVSKMVERDRKRVGLKAAQVTKPAAAKIIATAQAMSPAAIRGAGKQKLMDAARRAGARLLSAPNKNRAQLHVANLLALKVISPKRAELILRKLTG